MQTKDMNVWKREVESAFKERVERHKKQGRKLGRLSLHHMQSDFFAGAMISARALTIDNPRTNTEQLFMPAYWIISIVSGRPICKEEKTERKVNEDGGV